MPNKPQAESSALSLPVFRLLWLANLGSGIGATMHDTAAVWTLAELSGKAWVVTLYQALLSFPLFLFALPSGAFADIVDKRRLMFWVQIVGFFTASLLGFLAFVGWASVPVLLGGAFLLGATLAFGFPAWQASIPEMVGKDLLPSAITLGGVGINVSRAVGPFLGGYLVAWVGPFPVFLVNALSFLGLAYALHRWQRPEPEARPHAETVVGAMIAALRHVRYTRSIQRVYVRHGLFVFAGFAPVALLPMIVRALGLPASEFGLLMGVYGGGGIFSALVILPRLKSWLSVDAISAGSGILSAASMALLPFCGDTPSLALALFLGGSAWLIGMSQMAVSGQRVFPHWVRARASAIQMLVVQGMIAVGSVLWGALTESFGVSIALWLAGFTSLIHVAAVGALRIDQALNRDLSPVASDHQHDGLHFVPEADDGPVRVSVRYRVHPEDEAAFISAVAALRDSRLRDGAFRWHLWRDLETPNSFDEAFLVGSWEEHLRQAERMNALTREIEARVQAVHRGERGPRVSHAIHVEPGPLACVI